MRLSSTSERVHSHHRRSSNADLTHSYYDLATDLYEEGWAQSFHLCRFGVGETLLQALARHEHYLAHRIQIDQSMTVLDVGCGVGKPAREIATFTGCYGNGSLPPFSMTTSWLSGVRYMLLLL